MNWIIFILDWAGRIGTLIAIAVFVFGIIAWLKGIFPALLRLGNGLAKRKIVLFAKGSNVESLENMLLDSKLFKRKNIITVSHEGDIGRAEDGTLFLVCWHDWTGHIDEILQLKTDKVALIVYAPQDLGIVPQDDLKKLNSKRNTILSNFRGRLMNDIVVSMITTSYEKR